MNSHGIVLIVKRKQALMKQVAIITGGSRGIGRVKRRVPIKREGTAKEVANAILWLLSEEASYTTEASSILPAGDKKAEGPDGSSSAFQFLVVALKD
nr:SDR family oxidoreductase [uncultured Gimesia sp.]